MVQVSNDIAIGGIRYETNSFAAGNGTYDDFGHRFIRVGSAVLEAGPNTEIQGALSQAETLGVSLHGTYDTFGGMGGPVLHADYERLKGELLRQLRETLADVSAVYLPLHGAMTTSACADVEGDLAEAVRHVVGDRLLVVSFDLHGAPSEQLIANCDALVGFKTCPHIDYESTGARAIEIAVASRDAGRRPVVTRRAIPMLTPAEAHDTKDGPMAAFEAAAAELATRMGLLDVSIFMCQPWLDSPRTSWSVTATCFPDQVRAASTAIDDLARSIWSARASLTVDKLSVDQVVAVLSRGESSRRPYLISDSGDSPSAGSNGDSTELLDALLRLDVRGVVLATITDPAVARSLASRPVGSAVDVTVGGSLTHLTPPIRLVGMTRWSGHGRYHSSYPAGPVDVGAVTVVESGCCMVVVTERPATMLDPSLYRHVDLHPETAFAVQVKSAGGFRALWSPIGGEILVADTHGASDGNLPRLPFRNMPRPTWPFDESAAFVAA
jgi:microcystin degradation protein MlrC